MVEHLYKQNGFSNPRQHDLPPRPPRTPSTESLVTLNLDFVSQVLSFRSKNEIKRLKLPIRVNFTSKMKLRSLLCSSRPLDKRVCLFTNCNICPKINTPNKDCSVKNVVYKITCELCSKLYIGETERTAHERLTEHLRYAKHNLTPSNLKQALAIHYSTEHSDIINPNITFDILYIEPNTVRRKIYEAFMISKLRPVLNLKEELKTVQRFLTLRSRI